MCNRLFLEGCLCLGFGEFFWRLVGGGSLLLLTNYSSLNLCMLSSNLGLFFQFEEPLLSTAKDKMTALAVAAMETGQF